MVKHQIDLHYSFWLSKFRHQYDVRARTAARRPRKRDKAARDKMLTPRVRHGRRVTKMGVTKPKPVRRVWGPAVWKTDRDDGPVEISLADKLSLRIDLDATWFSKPEKMAKHWSWPQARDLSSGPRLWDELVTRGGLA